MKIGDCVKDRNGVRGIVNDIVAWENEDKPIGVIFEDEPDTTYWVNESEITLSKHRKRNGDNV